MADPQSWTEVGTWLEVGRIAATVLEHIAWPAVIGFLAIG